MRLNWSAPPIYDSANVGITGTQSTGIPVLLAQSYVPVSAPADTTEDTLATITVPAGTLGSNGALRIAVIFSATNSVGTKTFRVHYSGAAGTILFSQIVTTQVAAGGVLMMANTNSTSAQAFGAIGQINVATGANTGTAAVDTTASTTLVITAQKNTAGDTATLVGYTVEYIKASNA